MELFNIYHSSKIRPVIQGEKKTRYRNNIIFTIGFNQENNMVIGPLLSNGLVQSADSNLLVSELALEIFGIINLFISTKSQIPITNKDNGDGMWRHIQIRENTNGEYMIIFRLTNRNKYNDVFEEEMNNLIILLNNSSKYILKSIHYQEIIGKKEPTIYDKIVSVYHQGDLYQYMLGRVFLINPLCFFQVNYETASLIFQKVRDLVEIKSNNILLDLCCGVGVYSVLLSDLFALTYGIDVNPENIASAEKQKDNNSGMDNSYFIANKIENVIDQYLISDQITVIINPARSGLSTQMCELLLQKMSHISQIIYISCNPKTLIRDLDRLKISHELIHDVIPIDQFPQTDELEVIVNIKK